MAQSVRVTGAGFDVHFSDKPKYLQLQTDIKTAAGFHSLKSDPKAFFANYDVNIDDQTANALRPHLAQANSFAELQHQATAISTAVVIAVAANTALPTSTQVAIAF
jgi:hypothetical protein